MIVVHGTWAAPQTDTVRWYQPHVSATVTDHFITRLDAELEKRGSLARCWAHCSDAHPAFHWSGKNSWVERTHAAAALADEVARLKNAGWLCHIIAHSHGGNVAVEALQQITAQVGTTGPSGKLVTLGTPFLDAMAPIAWRADTLRRVLNLLYLVVSGLLVAIYVVGGSLWFWELNRPVGEKVELILILLVAWGALAALGRFVSRPWLLRRAQRKKRNTFQGPRMEAPSSLLDEFSDVIFRLHDDAASQTPLQVSLLAISSPMDEAWQVLHHLRGAEDPLAIRTGLLRYLLGAIRSHMSQGADIARIHGAKSYGDFGKFARIQLAFIHFFCFWGALALLVFLSPSRSLKIMDLAFVGFILFLPLVAVVTGTKTLGPGFYSAALSPFRWIARAIGSLISIPAFCTTYIVRRRSWSVLLAMAMGMEGYRFSLPVVEQWPRNLPEGLVRYEDMPRGAEQRAMDKRNAWIARHLGGVSRTFARMVISPADLSLLLATIEQDRSLIHAAYYTDDECIGRIADWIAGVR
ncbi:hypothetical protein [Bradyrhizobium centrolobii]|uniref:hypothetical protein n=1 Tax=Bradyrhizobium centrolobii TaxID=1505087 RepID=UPI0010A960C3|nr:hypothetical protein [Bradyrhizobium centrolobii]